MYIYNEGLYDNQKLKSDIPVGRFKPYVYTVKDFLNQQVNDKLPVFEIDTGGIVRDIKIKDCTLYIEINEYNLNHLRILDVIKILIDNDINVNIMSSYENLIFLPAILLSNMNTIDIHQVEGISSPIKSESLYKANASFAGFVSESQPISLTIFDLSTNKIKPYTKTDEDIFFEPSPQTTIITKLACTRFFMVIDFDTKLSINNEYISNILNNGAIG